MFLFLTCSRACCKTKLPHGASRGTRAANATQSVGFSFYERFAITFDLHRPFRIFRELPLNPPDTSEATVSNHFPVFGSLETTQLTRPYASCHRQWLTPAQHAVRLESTLNIFALHLPEIFEKTDRSCTKYSTLLEFDCCSSTALK